MDDLLDEAFAVVIPGMGLPRKYKLNGPVPVLAKFHDVIKLLEDERRALIRGKPARETNRQGIGIEQMVEANEIAGRHTCRHVKGTAADKLNHFTPLPITQCPQLLVRNERRVCHFLPEFGG